jgi:hypothetical protein
MNKRIQKKKAKQAEQAAEVQAAAAANENPAQRALELVRGAAKDVQKALRKGDAKQAVNIVRERAGEAIDQVTQQVSQVVSETQRELREKLEDTEQQAERLLKKVPGVGKAAAKKLHEVTHK